MSLYVSCLAVEIMNSAGEMFLTTGDVWYADRLEQIAFNALPVRPDASIDSGCEIRRFEATLVMSPMSCRR